jgi:hypothetical protein
MRGTVETATGSFAFGAAFLAAGLDSASAFAAAGFFAAGFLAAGFFTAAFLAAGFLAAGFFTAAFLAAGFLAAAFLAAGFEALASVTCVSFLSSGAFATLDHPYFRPVFEDLLTSATGNSGLWVDEHYIGDGYRAFTLDDSGLRHSGLGFDMASNHVHAFNHYPVLINEDSYHRAALTFIFSGDDQYLIIFLDSRLAHWLENLRRQRHDTHELLVSQFTSYRAKYSSATRVFIVADDHACVVVEPDVRTVGSSNFFRCSYDYRFHNLVHLYGATGLCVFYCAGDYIT